MYIYNYIKYVCALKCNRSMGHRASLKVEFQLLLFFILSILFLSY